MSIEEIIFALHAAKSKESDAAICTVLENCRSYLEAAASPQPSLLQARRLPIHWDPVGEAHPYVRIGRWRQAFYLLLDDGWTGQGPDGYEVTRPGSLAGPFGSRVAAMDWYVAHVRWCPSGPSRHEPQQPYVTDATEQYRLLNL